MSIENSRDAKLSKPVILVCILAGTANAFREGQEETLAAGMDGRLSKPIDIKLLDQADTEVPGMISAE